MTATTQAAYPRTERVPLVSVCIATHHRPDRLAACLAALAAQTIDPALIEVIVADDGSPAADRVPDVVAEAQRSAPFSIELISLPHNVGAAGARNSAARRARGHWLAFTDDDCRPRPDWLCALLAATAGHDIVQGRTVPDPARAHLRTAPRARTLEVESESGFYQTCNIAYRRSVFDALDGFDARFARSGEDTDLAWRGKAAGATTAFAEGAVVEHEVAVASRRDDLRRRARWADMPALVARHPHLRTYTWRNPIYRRSHVAPLATAAALPLLAWPRTRRLAALAGAAAVASEIVRAGDPTTAFDRLARRAADAYETAIVVRAALRERTVLL